MGEPIRSGEFWNSVGEEGAYHRAIAENPRRPDEKPLEYLARISELLHPSEQRQPGEEG